VAPSYPAGDPAGVDELRIPSLGFPPYPTIRISWPRAGRVTAHLDDFEPDLIHVATEGPLGLLGRHYALSRRRALVTSFHTDFPGYCAHYGAPALEPLVWRWLTWFHRPAGLTHTPGRAICAELARRGIGHAVVWGRAVDSGHFNPDRRSHGVRLAMGVADDQVLVLHVGRLAPEKNLEVLIGAARLTRESLGRVVFAIAGEGPMESRVAARAAWVRRLGFLDRDTLAVLLASADVCVLPSMTETCGLVAHEAMASGLAVIAADAGGFRDAIRSGEDGLLVPGDDPQAFATAIARLAHDPSERRRLGLAARAAAVRNDVELENAELLRQYHALTTETRHLPTWRAA
jgi:glycosyltransferase involved in cell wall biosynthesis